MPARSSVEGTFGFGMPRSATAALRVWTTLRDGDGSVTTGTGRALSFYCTGPNDGVGTGWSAIKSFFASATTIVYDWDWTTVDGIAYDWPFAITSATEPFSYSFPPKLASANTQSATNVSITVPAGQWVSFGVFSSDSCCGRGWCTFSGLPST